VEKLELTCSTYEREYGKDEKATATKHLVRQIRADSIRKLIAARRGRTPFLPPPA
jgi:hypothetical protein